MKYGDLLVKDQLGVDIKVGDPVLTLDWYSGSYYMQPSIALGIIKNSGNLRMLRLYTDIKHVSSVSGYITWNPKGKSLRLTQAYVSSILNDYAELHAYVSTQSEENFNILIKETLTVKQRKGFNLCC